MPLSLRMVSFSASFCWLGWMTPRDIFSLFDQIPNSKNPKDHHKPLQSVARKQINSGCCFSVVRFRPCSEIQGQRLPVLHPPSPCFFQSQGSGAVLIFYEAFVLRSLRSLIVYLKAYLCTVVKRLWLRVVQE